MRILRLLVLILTLLIGCRPSTSNYFPERVSFEVINPLNEERHDVTITIPLADMPVTGSFLVRSNEIILPAQFNAGVIYAVLGEMTANDKRTVTVYYNPTSTTEQPPVKKRTQAELSHRSGGTWKDREYIGGEFRNVDYLRVPAEHKDHSWFIRYEGPGWESDKVGYRLYLDQRNAIDVFGKKTSDMILIGVGQDGFDSYHNMQTWGMDIMKVGKSLGLGSIGFWNDSIATRVEFTDSVVCGIGDGNLRSGLSTVYYGWKTPGDTVERLLSNISIMAGSRLTTHMVRSSKEINGICTGIVKDDKGKLIKSMGGDSSFGYLATFGKQSLNNDNLGLVILFNPASFVEFHEDEFSHVVEFKMNDKTIEYALGAAWELENKGITNEADFIKWVEKSARELANPVIVNAKK